MSLTERHGAGAGAGHDDDPCGDHNHAMVFHSCVCAEILFNGWKTTNELELFGSCVVIFVAALMYEGFKVLREEVRPPAPAHRDTNKGDNTGRATVQSLKWRLWSRWHVSQTLLHGAQTTVSYLLMLVFMTYNVWLCLALVLGLTLGYFLFGWRRAHIADTNECCH